MAADRFERILHSTLHPESKARLARLSRLFAHSGEDSRRASAPDAPPRRAGDGRERGAEPPPSARAAALAEADVLAEPPICLTYALISAPGTRALGSDRWSRASSAHDEPGDDGCAGKAWAYAAPRIDDVASPPRGSYRRSGPPLTAERFGMPYADQWREGPRSSMSGRAATSAPPTPPRGAPRRRAALDVLADALRRLLAAREAFAGAQSGFGRASGEAEREERRSHARPSSAQRLTHSRARSVRGGYEREQGGEPEWAASPRSGLSEQHVRSRLGATGSRAGARPWNSGLVRSKSPLPVRRVSGGEEARWVDELSCTACMVRGVEQVPTFLTR